MTTPLALRAQEGETLTKVALRAVYDSYCVHVLTRNGFLEAIPRAERKEQPRFKVIKPLPRLETYLQLRDQQYARTVEDIVGGAQSDVEELASELRSWYDNLPDGIRDGDRGSALEEAASALENLSFPNVPEFLSEEKVIHLPALKAESRSDRRNDVVLSLHHVCQDLEDKKESYPEDQQDEVESFIVELENLCSDLDPIEFPGMYG